METTPEGILSGKIIGCAIEVHKQIGPGLLESVYEECLCFELSQEGLYLERQFEVPIEYKKNRLNSKLRLDLIVNNEVIVEIKSVRKLENIHSAQLLSYLKLTNRKYGLLINFNVELLKLGIKRIAN
ncbi:MAG: GxxExxY protein [Kangiellaceae bacterium]|nr:GxxExxY protein [Kangiellaceae bacterium]